MLIHVLCLLRVAIVHILNYFYAVYFFTGHAEKIINVKMVSVDTSSSENTSDEQLSQD